MHIQYGILELQEGKWFFTHRSLQGDCKTHLFNDTHKPPLLEVLDRLGSSGWEFAGNLKLSTEDYPAHSLVFIRRR